MATIIPEEEVSIETLHTLLDRVFFRAKLDEDGDLYVADGLEFPIGGPNSPSEAKSY